jgi:hypothetical protein
MALDRSQKYVVLLNGPPGCGKDTVQQHLVQYLQFSHMKFAAPIKRMAAALLDIDVSAIERHKDAEFNILCKEIEVIRTSVIGYEDAKQYEYGPKDTLRKLLIRLSEEYLKPTYGNTFFGRLAVRELKRSAYPLVIFTDSGFYEEAHTVVRNIGRENTILIRLHREGCDFGNDSRSYLRGVAGEERDIENNGPINHTAAQVVVAIRNHFGLKLLKEIEL